MSATCSTSRTRCPASGPRRPAHRSTRTTECRLPRRPLGGSGLHRAAECSTPTRAEGTSPSWSTALGHHVIKAGVDGSLDRTTSTSRPTAVAAWYFDSAGGSTPGDSLASPRGPPVRVPHRTPTTPVRLDSLTRKSKSIIVGFFVQDSWSILDKVTLNVGLRYDTLPLRRGRLAPHRARSDQWSPAHRRGLGSDPAGPLEDLRQLRPVLRDRSPSTSPTASSAGRDARPVEPRLRPGRWIAGSTAATRQPRLTIGVRPNQSNGGSDRRTRVPVDPRPQVAPPTTRWSPAPSTRCCPTPGSALNYTYRNLVRTVEDMSNDEANTYFIGNPGEGIADTFPKAKRTYHAVTRQLHQDLLRPLAGAGQLHLVAADRELRRPVRSERTGPARSRTSTRTFDLNSAPAEPGRDRWPATSPTPSRSTWRRSSSSARCSASRSACPSPRTPGPPISYARAVRIPAYGAGPGRTSSSAGAADGSPG